MRTFSIVALLILGLLFSLKCRAYADEVSIGINPPIVEISAIPPATIDAPITIQNQSDKSVRLKIFIRPFQASLTNNGELTFLVDDTFSIKQKILVLDPSLAPDQPNQKIEKIKLEPYEEKTLTLHIILNKEERANDYYFSILFLTEEPKTEQKSLSKLTYGIGTNVLLSIGPKGPTTGEISTFSTPFFHFHGAVPLTLLVKNTSNHFITPTGKITLDNMFGQRIANINLLPQVILARSLRFLTDSKQASPSPGLVSEVLKLKIDHPVVLFSQSFLFGFYTARLSLSLSDSTPALTSTIHFLAIPLLPLAVLTLVLIILLGIYLRVKKKI